MLFSLCPTPDTGKFYFTELLKTQEQIDTFYGIISVFPEKLIKMEVTYPQKQMFLFRSDSIFMLSGADTQVIYRKGLSNLIFHSVEDSSCMLKKIESGCMVIPKDDSIPKDTLFIFGRKNIDSLRYIGDKTILTLYLRRGK